MMDATDLQTRILEAAAPLAAFEGWRNETLAEAATSLGLTAFDAKRAFPGGVSEALALYAAEADRAMLATLARDYHLESMKIREKIATAVLVRFRLQWREREAVRRALLYYAKPWNSASGIAALAATCDAIWRAAGDTATDYNYYTKRLLLGKVIAATTSTWLKDSEDLAATETRLRTEIERIMQIQKWKAKAGGLFGKVAC